VTFGRPTHRDIHHDVVAKRRSVVDLARA